MCRFIFRVTLKTLALYCKYNAYKDILQKRTVPSIHQNSNAFPLRCISATF